MCHPLQSRAGSREIQAPRLNPNDPDPPTTPRPTPPYGSFHSWRLGWVTSPSAWGTSRFPVWRRRVGPPGPAKTSAPARRPRLLNAGPDERAGRPGRKGEMLLGQTARGCRFPDAEPSTSFLRLQVRSHLPLGQVPFPSSRSPPVASRKRRRDCRPLRLGSLSGTPVK